MLVLQRKISERIRIGDDIIITVCDITKTGARIGIECPREITVLREELYRPRVEREDLCRGDDA